MRRRVQVWWKRRRRGRCAFVAAAREAAAFWAAHNELDERAQRR